jgi:hypothetical protein
VGSGPAESAAGVEADRRTGAGSVACCSYSLKKSLLVLEINKKIKERLKCVVSLVFAPAVVAASGGLAADSGLVADHLADRQHALLRLGRNGGHPGRHRLPDLRLGHLLRRRSHHL